MCTLAHKSIQHFEISLVLLRNIILYRDCIGQA